MFVEFRLATCLIAALATLSCSAVEALEVASVSCEHLRSPHGIDTSEPRLSWTLRSDTRGNRQTAYQVLVATTPEQLAAGEADAWDSGKIESDESVLVPYEGRKLASHEQLYWKVRVWDVDGKPSDWSAPADWIMGLLADDPWEAEWIGLEVPTRQSQLTDAQWIWFPEGEPTKSAPVEKRFFRRVFDVPDSRSVSKATLQITGDDQVQIFFNGRDLGTKSGHPSTKELDLTNKLRAGQNVLAVRGENHGTSPNPAGIIAKLTITSADGHQQVITSDADWRTTRRAEAGWEEMAFDDSAWTAAKVLGEVGCEPWGTVRVSENRELSARYVRHEFKLDAPVERAVVSWCGLGSSELFVNGQQVGDQVLSPAMSQYPERAYYVTRDVTDSLGQNTNVLAATLGNGRFFAPRGESHVNMPNYGSPCLRLRLTIWHPDGTTTVVTSDDSWKLTDQGPIVANNEYDGEVYDARRELGDWQRADYDASDWQRVERIESPTKRLRAEPIEPMRITQSIEPVSVTEVRPDVYVYDLGQNLVGWCRLKVKGPAGTTVRLRHAERLTDEGELYVANLRSAEATDYYTLKGGETEVWEPRFTMHGFRFVEVTGYPGEPTLDAITAKVIHDDLDPVGRFECANEVINQVYQNARWGFRGNYRTVPLDCPQRDERQGWLGDRLETARSESYTFHVAAFYEKWLQDIRDSQKANGSLPDVAPIHWPMFSDNVVWPSTAVLLPGILYEQYGDLRPIEDQYQSNVRWIEFMNQFVRDDGLIARNSYGDWCVPPESPELIHAKEPSRITDTTLLASAFYQYDLQLMAKYARLLDRDEEATRFAAQADKLREAVNRTYYKPDEHQYSNGTQTSSVLPLAFGLPPQGERSPLAKTLVRHVTKRDDGAIATGLVGAQFLCRTLTDIGRPDLAFEIASREDYPSWGYMASQGATTIWELWNGDTANPAMNSGNHVMLVGDLVTWLYEDLAGIAADPSEPGFKRIIMQPQPVEGLPWARASLRSPRGRIESDWRRDGKAFHWRVLVPPGSTAEVHLPTDNQQVVKLDGKPLQEIDGVSVIGVQKGRVVAELPSGNYQFVVDDTSNVTQKR